MHLEPANHLHTLPPNQYQSCQIYLKYWLFNWKNIESPIKGDDLIAKGWEPGPKIGIEIKRQRMKLIDEKIIF